MNSKRLRSILVAASITAPLLIAPQAAQPVSQTSFWGELAWDTAIAGEGETRFRYGNWYGPGWWGGSELDHKVGALPPVDALDAVAQKHDFGYALAERLAKHDRNLEAHYKAVADAIAVRDTLRLPKDPRDWVPRPRDVDLARKYVERIALGFPNYQQRLNQLKTVLPLQPDITDPAVLNAILDLEPGQRPPVLSNATLEALMEEEVERWNAAHRAREAREVERRAFAQDRASRSASAREDLHRKGMVCTCEDWNRDGAYGVVIGKEIVRANIGSYATCLEHARALPICEYEEDRKLAAMICTCEDWNRDGAFGVVIGKKIITANYGTHDECLEYARGLSVCTSGQTAD